MRHYQGGTLPDQGAGRCEGWNTTSGELRGWLQLRTGVDLDLREGFHCSVKPLRELLVLQAYSPLSADFIVLPALFLGSASNSVISFGTFSSGKC